MFQDLDLPKTVSSGCCHRAGLTPHGAAAACLILLLVPHALWAGAGQSTTVEDRLFLASCDKSPQKYVLMAPRNLRPGERVSLLIALHGHGSDRWQFVRENRGECRATRDVAAATGMLLVSPDYRAKTSWMGPKAEADVLQIIQIMKERYTVERIVLCGGSMGGAASLTFAALHPDLIDGVVSLNGTANLVAYEGFPRAIAASFGGTRDQVPDEYRKRSAVFAPQRFTMPLAATTGGRDTVVPPDSVRKLLQQVRMRNPHVLGIHRPTGGHDTSYKDTRRALEFVLSAMSKTES